MIFVIYLQCIIITCNNHCKSNIFIRHATYVVYSGYTGQDDVIKWKHFPHHQLFVNGSSPVIDELHSQRPKARSFDVFFLSAPEETVEQTIKRPVTALIHDVTVMLDEHGQKNSDSSGNINPLWSSDAIWRHGYLSVLLLKWLDVNMHRDITATYVGLSSTST